MIDSAKLQARGTYRFAPTSAITDPTLLAVATEYENNVSRKMVAITPADLTRRFAGGEKVLSSTKIDGEGVFLYFDATGPTFLYSAPSGRVRFGFAAVDDAAAKLKKAGHRKGLFRAELFVPGERDGRRLGVAEVIRASFSGEPAEVEALRLAVFDAIMLDGRDLRAQQADFGTTWELLGKLFGEDPTQPSHRVPGCERDETELPAEFQSIVAGGGEGLVIRRLRRPEIIKTKPQRTVDAVVIGYVEGEFEGKYGVTSLLTALNYPRDGQKPLWLQAFARVGSGLSDDQRTGLLAALGPLKVEAPLAMTDSDGRTIHFVKPELMIELAGEDLVTTTGRTENKTQLLAWDGSAYRFGGLGSFPRLTFARFSGFREDKALAQGGARIEQILAQPGEPQPAASSQTAGGDPRVVRREVYTKGDDMLRKLVVVERAAEEGSFPFVVYWTDFSSKRAEPLKVSVSFARHAERAQALGEQYLKDGITRGFVRFGQEAGTAEGAAPAEAKPAKPRAKKTPKAEAAGVDMAVAPAAATESEV